MSARRVAYRIRTGLWLVPLLCLAAGVGLSFATIAIDRASDFGLVPSSLTGTSTGAQTILSTIATATVELAALVLSLTLVAVQLAMGQFSPRIVRALLSDRRSQLAIGVLLGSFAFAVLGLREIGLEGGEVPGVTVLTAYVLAIGSVAALVLYVHYAGQSLRVAGLIDLVGDELRVELDKRYGASAGSPETDGREILARDPGVLFRLDTEGLVEVARRHRCRLEVVPTMGDFVPAGTALIRVDGELGDGLEAEIRKRIWLGRERTHFGDPAYGFRKLVDIAERSIADPFNDPTTAVQAIDRLHDCLRQIASRPFPSGEHRDVEGTLRVVSREITWAGYVQLSFAEIRLAGASSPQVTRRLRAALEDLKTVAAEDRREPLDRELQLLEQAVDGHYDDEHEAHSALEPDQQGIGSGADLVLAGERES